MSFEWSETVTRDLMDLWAEGHSTAEIGRRLGVSKNAIVGKAHRLDLENRPSPIRTLGSGEKLKRMLEREQRVRSRLLGKGKTLKSPAAKSTKAREADEFAKRIAAKLVGSGGGVVKPEPPATPEPYLDPRRDPRPVPVAPEPVPEPVPASPVEPGEDVVPPETPERPVEAPERVVVHGGAAEHVRQCEMLNGKLKPWVRCEGLIERIGESWCETCRKVVFEKAPPRTAERDHANITRWMKQVA